MKNKTVMSIKHVFRIILFFFPLSVFGQVQIGLKGGINIATVTTTNIPNNFEYNSIIGFSFGPTVRFKLNDKLHLNSDFLFSTRGYEIYSYKTTINYLEMPLLLSYSIVNNLEVEFGPDLGLKLFIESDQEPSLSYRSFHLIDFGPTAGLRYSLLENFFVSARYYHGITSIATFYRTQSGESKTLSRAFQFTLGYYF